jgi:hypothetical protein
MVPRTASRSEPGPRRTSSHSPSWNEAIAPTYSASAMASLERK